MHLLGNQVNGSLFSETESRCRCKVFAKYATDPFSIARGLNQTLNRQKLTQVGKFNSQFLVELNTEEFSPDIEKNY